MKTRMSKSFKKKLIFGTIIWLSLLLIYLPIFVLVIFSFSQSRTINMNNFDFGFGVWRDLFNDSNLMSAVGNTVLIATISAFIAVIIGTMASVAIVRMRRRSKSFIMSLNQIPLINADIVTSFSLVLFFVAVGIFNAGYLKLILAHTLIALPVVVLIILPRLRSLDQNLFEAAQDLGARPFYALFKVIVPQLLPAMITAFLLGFTLSLDDFIITQYNNDGIHTISTVAYDATSKGGIPAVFRALSALIFFLVVVIVIILNFRFAKKVKKEILDKR